ncbi:unnamed protein product, partial [Tenebrio molitor]
SAIFRGFTTVAPNVCIVFIRGRLGGVFPVQQVLASPWRKSVSAGEDVQGVLQPNADPSEEPDRTSDSPRSRTPSSRNRETPGKGRFEGRKDPEDLPWIRTA